MSRLPPVPHDEWDEDAFAAMSQGHKLPPSNALGLLAHHPDLAKAFLGFNMHLLGSSTLPKRTRELAVLRVAWRRRCQYEWAQHLLIARRAGVTDEEIAEIRTGADTPINRAVDELETDSTLSDATYQALAADLNDRQLMDLVFTVGAYGLLAMAFNTFEVELDPGFSAENFTDSIRE
jgi:AhpD family alkylhydroperoxidase